MEVGIDLKNVYVWAEAREMLPLLAARMVQEGQKGRKFDKVSLGDAASIAILKACREYGLELTPVGDRRKAVPVVLVEGLGEIKDRRSKPLDQRRKK